MKKPDFNVEMLINFSNKQKAVIIGAGVVLSLALIGGGVHASNQNKYAEEMQKQIETAKAEQVEYTVGNDVADFDFDSIPYVKDGYANVDDYWNDVQEMRSSAEGIADSAIRSYGAYMTDEQKEQLRQYEKSMTGAATIEDFNSAKESFDEIVDDCRPVYVYIGGGSGGSYGGSYSDFMRDGIVYHNGNKFTYYSERVLPGGGLNIPGRHTSGGFVRDKDGYIVIASDKSNGTVVDTPFGQGKVYDSGVSGNHYDIYVE